MEKLGQACKRQYGELEDQSDKQFCPLPFVFKTIAFPFLFFLYPPIPIKKGVRDLTLRF